MNYYRRYMGDYSRDTSHLSLAEHGAYNVLLDHYYSSRTPLPESLDGLYRICRAMSKPEQQAVQTVARQFFPVGADGLRHNPRADAELQLWDARAKTSRGNGGKGGRPKKEPDKNPAGSDSDNPQETGSETQREPAHNPIPEARSQKLEVRTQNPEGCTPPAAPGLKRSRRNVPRETAPDPDWFVAIKLEFPERSGGHEWAAARRAANARLKEGHKSEDLVAGAKRYAAYVRATGSEGTQYVKTAQVFFGPSEDRHFLKTWAPPASKSARRQDGNVAASREWLRDQEAADASH